MKKDLHPIISSHLRTLLGSYRPEIEEQDDIPEILISFGTQSRANLIAEVQHLLENEFISRTLLEALTGQDAPSDKSAREFFASFLSFLQNPSSAVPDLDDYA